MANAFYEAEEGEIVSANVTPARRFFRNGREMAPEELSIQYAAVHNIDVQGAEFEVLMPSSKRRTLRGYASPLCAPDGQVRVRGSFIDLTERATRAGDGSAPDGVLQAHHPGHDRRQADDYRPARG